MTTSQTKQTSTVANCRICVEQAIKNLKDIRILEGETCLHYLSIADDIIKRWSVSSDKLEKTSEKLNHFSPVLL